MEKKEEYNPEEELDVGNWKIIDLKKQEEAKKENITELFKARTKLYRWNDKESTWQERGTGNVMIIKNEDDGRIRFTHV